MHCKFFSSICPTYHFLLKHLLWALKNFLVYCETVLVFYYNSSLLIFWLSGHKQNNWRWGSRETMGILNDILLFPRSLVFNCFVHSRSIRISKVSYCLVLLFYWNLLFFYTVYWVSHFWSSGYHTQNNWRWGSRGTINIPYLYSFISWEAGHQLFCVWSPNRNIESELFMI